ncbi:TIGR02391 family protein [Mycolicibacterium nivoides]|uniref:TIGR02391 family protein n=1 Tax=Mycolicibacterium nivoides TaxID=2487344 RepID=A0ABW9L8L1_9MYCO
MTASSEAASPQPADEITPAGVPRLHDLIVKSSGRQFANGLYDDAIFNAFKAVEDRTKTLSGNSDIGKRLMAYAFNKDSPKLNITSPNADIYQKADEREGYMFLFMGAALGIRNPRGHGGHLDTAEEEAAELLILASLLMRALDRAEEQLALQPPELDNSGEWDEDDDALGPLDRIAAMEDAMPEVKATVEEMAVCLQEFTSLTNEYAPKINAVAENPRMSARLIVVQALADELKPPAQKFRELAADYVGQIIELDSGLGAFTELQPFADMSTEEQAQYLFLAEQVRNLRDASIQAVAGAATMSQSFTGVAKLSKALKKPSADLRDGVRQLQSVLHYYDEWVDGFKEMGVWGDNPF